MRKKVTLLLSSTTKWEGTEMMKTDSHLRCTGIGEAATDARHNKENSHYMLVKKSAL